MRQYSFKLGSDFRGGVSRVELHGAPFHKPEDFLTATVQHGEIKVYGLCDDSEESVEHEFLVVGTGADIHADYLDNLVLAGTVLLADSKYGYTVYYVKQEEGEKDFDGVDDEMNTSGSLPVSLDPFQSSSNSIATSMTKGKSIMLPKALNTMIAVLPSDDPVELLNLKAVLGKLNEVVSIESSKGRDAIEDCLSDYEDSNVLIITTSRADSITPNDLISLFGVIDVITH